jgi:hypothetical protein
MIDNNIKSLWRIGKGEVMLTIIFLISALLINVIEILMILNYERIYLQSKALNLNILQTTIDKSLIIEEERIYIPFS